MSNIEKIEEAIEEIIDIFKGYQYEISDGFTSSAFWEDIASELRIVLEKMKQTEKKK